jgi:hypothetical protein
MTGHETVSRGSVEGTGHATGAAGLEGVRVVAYGGGVQSTALLVLAAQQRIDYATFVFANVGDDSEHPGTLRYLDEHARPYATRHGIELVTLDRVRRDGAVETLYGRLTREGSRSLPIPVRMDNGAPGTRSCTADFKIRVIGKWLKAHGANADTPATVAVGISLDEIHRINNRRQEPYENTVYPLVDIPAGAGIGRCLTRAGCARIIHDAGLPVPPKSACWFCPYHRPSTWQTMRAEEPVLFDRAVELERLLNQRREALGKDRVWLTRFAAPLDRVIPAGVQTLPLAEDQDAACDNGWCFT